MWKTIIICGYMLIVSHCDYKEKKVPAVLLLAGGIGTGMLVACAMVEKELGGMRLLLGLVPGSFLLLVAQLTKKAGYADGVILLFLGLLYGYKESFFLLCGSLLLLSAVSIALLILHKVHKNTRLPYLPFLTVTLILDRCLLCKDYL